MGVRFVLFGGGLLGSGVGPIEWCQGLQIRSVGLSSLLQGGGLVWGISA